MVAKAFFFDVFGTVVDWREGVAREARTILHPLGHDLIWTAFADAWRAEYQPGMEEIRSGRLPFAKLDVVHARTLERILPDFGLSDISDITKRALVLAWHRLDAWPDSTRGIAMLRKHALLAPVSNGNISLMAALARRNNFHWDAILGAEFSRDYKPKPDVYLSACAAFDLAPEDCMMVAAHSDDLAAAKACGLQTGFVARPDEKGPGKGESTPKIEVDVAGDDMIDLARKIFG
ncbi:MAG: haloacid dehalogenase type II [Rhodoblastus sp.]|nr:haloacid dehalogenase type II [Rhodoblastus sp.]MCB9998819.1 haloacid dehalogenase type II [Methylobacteriaceae bacterium]HPG02705.1 haloacid dehalogenase type II [Rhodoblastus sp.]